MQLPAFPTSSFSFFLLETGLRGQRGSQQWRSVGTGYFPSTFSWALPVTES